MVFVARDQPDGSSGASEHFGSFGAKTRMVDAKMKSVQASPSRRSRKPIQYARRQLPQKHPCNSIGQADMTGFVHLADVMQQSRNEEIVIRHAGLAKMRIDGKEMSLIERGERSKCRRLPVAEEIGQRSIKFRDGQSIWSHCSQPLSNSMNSRAVASNHRALGFPAQPEMKLIALAKRLYGGEIISFVIDGKPSQLVAKKSRKMIMKPYRFIA